ncbi:glycosyltransferase family 8 protein [Brachyspira pilosicoli]|uniref:Glycosyltransferase family 8 protein n=1 Tax=Brachyspira pilosicoli TaxID=52584 RepID=A0AAJ6GDL5_BRAPL|nr:glycosyltransferase [Brachyspira pilosicoli]WIH89895.1 glycosyltransferase family 8 protein [Brachyspira pilosicoli]WIH92190.1 glycosyltransferase family 8 protein [Brachyspira pilosicoli]WIH94419.1 glycosyltransferase family 8 protein [Brachyspira pilosicoli]
MQEYNICLCADNNVVEYMSALIVSILRNSSQDEEFIFHIITSCISEENKNYINELKNIKNFQLKYYNPIHREKFEKWYSEKTPQKWPVEVFFKLDIPFILKDLDKVLYLDCDMIAVNNFKELFDINMDNYTVAAAKDKLISNSHLKKIKLNKSNGYFNSGLLLINIKNFNTLFPNDTFLEKIDKYLNNIKIVEYPEQDIINIIFNNKIKPIDSKYNCVSAIVKKDKEVQDTIIAHYTLLKPLYKNAYPQKNKLYYAFWKYFIETPYFKNNTSKYVNILIEQGNQDIIKHNKLIDSISWWIPFREMRNNFKLKYKKETKYI